MTVPKVLIEIKDKQLVVSASHQIELVIADPGGVSAFGVMCPDSDSEEALARHSRYFNDHAERVKAPQ